MKTTITAIALALALSQQASAIVEQTVYLKNGTELRGYIQEQDRNENITFATESAIISVGRRATIQERSLAANELSESWREWAEKNNAFTGTGTARRLVLSDISFALVVADSAESGEARAVRRFENELPSGVTRVRVLERGTVTKYLELTPSRYVLNWKDIREIRAERRAPTMLSGLDRTYALSGGEVVEGQYAGETYNTVSLYKKSDGSKQTFNYRDVTSYTVYAHDAEQDIFQQSALLDVLYCRLQGTRTGIIIERNYAPGSKHVVLLQQGGAKQTVKFADIARYGKEVNKAYAPREDIIVPPGRLLVNRHAADTVEVKRDRDRLVLSGDTPKLTLKSGGNETVVTVEYANAERRPTDNLILVSLDAEQERRRTVFSFSTDLFSMRQISATSSGTSVNGTTRLEFRVSGTGVFALYDKQLRRAMPFVVK